MGWLALQVPEASLGKVRERQLQLPRDPLLAPGSGLSLATRYWPGFWGVVLSWPTTSSVTTAASWKIWFDRRSSHHRVLHGRYGVVSGALWHAHLLSILCSCTDVGLDPSRQPVEIHAKQKPSAKDSVGFGIQAWANVMSAYVEKRSQLEAEVKKYSDPPSDHLLPDLPPQVR